MECDYSHRFGYLNGQNEPHIVLGAILFARGAIQLLPAIRRRAAERGLSGGIAIPLILACIGFVVFLVGALVA